jgi:hypothetical protein
MPDIVIRPYRSTVHDWGTKGHGRATCSECKEPAVVSVDWLGDSAWAGSYCNEHLQRAIVLREKRLGRSLAVDDRRLR